MAISFVLDTFRRRYQNAAKATRFLHYGHGQPGYNPEQVRYAVGSTPLKDDFYMLMVLTFKTRKQNSVFVAGCWRRSRQQPATKMTWFDCQISLGLMQKGKRDSLVFVAICAGNKHHQNTYLGLSRVSMFACGSIVLFPLWYHFCQRSWQK